MTLVVRMIVYAWVVEVMIALVVGVLFANRAFLLRHDARRLCKETEQFLLGSGTTPGR